MFDLRYHVASLAAVFLALIIGILVGVGISDRGLVEQREDNAAAARGRKPAQPARPERPAGRRPRPRAATPPRRFINETYPALARNRLSGKHDRGRLRRLGQRQTSARRSAARSPMPARQQVRLRALKVPVDAQQLDKMLAAQPRGRQFRGPGTPGGARPGTRRGAGARRRHAALELSHRRSGRATGRREQEPGRRRDRRAHGRLRRRDEPKFLHGLYAGLGSAGVPAVGVEPTRPGQVGGPGLPPGRPLDRRRHRHAGRPACARASARRRSLGASTG